MTSPGAWGQTPPGKGERVANPTTQPAKPATARTNPNNPMLWDVDQMMEDAVMQITRRYNLNKAQENYTRLLLQERVREFLDEYEVDVRELLQESIDMRLNKRDNSPKSLMEWAIRAAPLYEAAKNAILGGNEEWREILDEKQKKIHDQDMAQMRANFANVTKALNLWIEGKGSLSGATASTQNGASEVSGSRVSPPGGRRVVVAEIEDNWLAYVNKFIQAYHLDEKQAIAAREKIHREELSRAKKYREQKKETFRTIATQLASKDRKIKATELMRRKRELEQPIRRIFVAMDRRLQRLTTTEQRANVDPSQKKMLGIWYRTLSGEGLQVSRPSVKPEKTVKHTPLKKKPTPSSNVNRKAQESKAIQVPTTQSSKVKPSETS